MIQRTVGNVTARKAGLRRKLLPVVIPILLAPGAAWAADSVLSGTFDGGDPKTTNLPGNCSFESQLPYQQIPFQVIVNGVYNLFDAFNFNGIDVTALVYQGAFNPNNPQQNLLTLGGVDDFASVDLMTGIDYRLVVQQWCQTREGAWAVTFAGPGNVNSSARRTVPAFTSGSFSNADPLLNSECGNTQFRQSGPIQVSRSGTYFYTDISIAHAVDLCLQIYSAPVNVSNPSQNRIADFDDFGQVELTAGQDYYFVVQPLDTPQSGAYFYVFAPPAEFRLNPGMAGSWHNPATGGQGFFLDVFDNINQLFLAWFTYDLARPAPSVAAEIGDPGHRWLTAFGPFSGASATLDIEWTAGGVFDAPLPATTQSLDGTIELEFTGCNNGTVTYDLGASGVTGVVPIRRIANDSIPLCESLTEGPGMPGLL
jgi:hypothetical protein